MSRNKEAYKTWNMGMGMALIVDSADVDNVLKKAEEQGMTAQIVGKISRDLPQEIHLNGKAFNGEVLVFKNQ